MTFFLNYKIIKDLNKVKEKLKKREDKLKKPQTTPTPLFFRYRIFPEKLDEV